MLTKEYIGELKSKNNEEISNLIKNQHSAGNLNFILENLGHLPIDFQGDFLYELLSHSNSQVRLNAVKNIGKLKTAAKIDTLFIYINRIYAELGFWKKNAKICTCRGAIYRV